MIPRLRLSVLGLCLAGCLSQSFGVWIEPPPPPPPEPPVPAPFQSEEPPALVPTRFPGLMAAPELDPTLYFFEPHERWYRYAFNRWYEAFAWNGNWFPPEQVPEPLEEGPLSDPRDPSGERP